MTMNTNRADSLSRPAARFDAAGNLIVRASSALGCRRALWYGATGQPITNPRPPESLTVMEAGSALEPVVLRAMERAGWQVTPADAAAPRSVSASAGPNLVVAGRPDATGVHPRSGEEMLIEVKTRGPNGYKRWVTLGAERSHPEAVAQAAIYTLGLYREMRDAVIATMDTASREWAWECIPAHRLERLFQHVCSWLGQLADHQARSGTDPAALPAQDFPPQSWQCRNCSFLTACRPEAAAAVEEPDDQPGMNPEPVSEAEARAALRQYEEVRAAIKELEERRNAAREKLLAWLQQQGVAQATLEGPEQTHTLRMAQRHYYHCDYQKLNELLDPETRAEIVTEKKSEYLRIN